MTAPPPRLRPSGGSRTGRRPGNPDTRQAILDAAARTFGGVGYAGATIRAIAAEAGVDAALVHHYFGSKNELFLHTVKAPIDPGEIARSLAGGDPADLGVRLIRTLLGVWDSPDRSALLAVVRSAMSDPSAARMIREFLGSQVIDRLLRAYRVPDHEIPFRGSLVASQIVGLITARYALGFEPLATAPPEVVVAAVGPTVQRYMTGDLGG